jgi:hypothetical protein
LNGKKEQYSYGLTLEVCCLWKRTMLEKINNIGPSEAETLSCTDQNKDRDNLWNQYRPFYEEKRKEYEGIWLCRMVLQ